jgi:hypothetical protein
MRTHEMFALRAYCAPVTRPAAPKLRPYPMP